MPQALALNPKPQTLNPKPLVRQGDGSELVDTKEYLEIEKAEAAKCRHLFDHIHTCEQQNPVSLKVQRLSSSCAGDDLQSVSMLTSALVMQPRFADVLRLACCLPAVQPAWISAAASDLGW